MTGPSLQLRGLTKLKMSLTFAQNIYYAQIEIELFDHQMAANKRDFKNVNNCLHFDRCANQLLLNKVSLHETKDASIFYKCDMTGPSLQRSRWTKLKKRIYSSSMFAQNINYTHIEIELLTARWQQRRRIS
jgi:hypothetical protein